MSFKIETLLQQPEHIQRCEEFVREVTLLAKLLKGCNFIVFNTTTMNLDSTNFLELPPELQTRITRDPNVVKAYLAIEKRLADYEEMRSLNTATAAVSLIAVGPEEIDTFVVYAASEEVKILAEAYGGNMVPVSYGDINGEAVDEEDSPVGNIYGADGKIVKLFLNEGDRETDTRFSLDYQVYFHSKE